MMMALSSLLAQIDPNKLNGLGEPPLDNAESSFGLTWVIACVLIALIIFVTFKTSKRNAMDRQ